MGTIAKSKTVFSTGLESMSYAVKKCHVPIEAAGHGAHSSHSGGRQPGTFV
jgi:hypothetical protein